MGTGIKKKLKFIFFRVPTYMPWQNSLTFWGEFSLTFPDCLKDFFIFLSLNSLTFQKNKILPDFIHWVQEFKKIKIYLFQGSHLHARTKFPDFLRWIFPDFPWLPQRFFFIFLSLNSLTFQKNKILPDFPWFSLMVGTLLFGDRKIQCDQWQNSCTDHRASSSAAWRAGIYLHSAEKLSQFF